MSNLIIIKLIMNTSNKSGNIRNIRNISNINNNSVLLKVKNQVANFKR